MLVRSALALLIVLAGTVAAVTVVPPKPGYETTLLVASNNSAANVHAQRRINNFINSWGLTRTDTSPWWIAVQGSGVEQVLDGSGLSVFPIPVVDPTGFQPTGIVSDPKATFILPNTESGALFLMCSLDGNIAGWNPNTPTTATTLFGRSMDAGAVYTGLGLYSNGNLTYLYAADSWNGRVDTWKPTGNRFLPGQLLTETGNFRGAFALSRTQRRNGFKPFNVQVFGENVYVTLAKFDHSGNKVMHRGFGYVNVYDKNGRMLGSFGGPHSLLNTPWGLEIVPAESRLGHGATFGPSAAAHVGTVLLVGNFGDGLITRWESTTSKPYAFLSKGTLKQSNGSDVKIAGLWGLGFGAGSGVRGSRSGLATALYYTAGPANEKDGEFGTVTWKA